MAWAEDPPSRTRHFVSNIEVEPGQRDSELRVYSNFIMYRTRGETEEDFYVGSREDVLRREGGQLKGRLPQDSPGPDRPPRQERQQLLLTGSELCIYLIVGSPSFPLMVNAC